MKWPEGKTFAFTIFDDTDGATLNNVKEIYQFFRDLNMRTTKSIWPIQGSDTAMVGGDTCENRKYLNWVLSLKDDGFEIGFHNATFHSSDRQQTIRGLDRFYKLFGHNPKTMANHANCRESMYWGPHRLSHFNRLCYLILTRFKHRNTFRGHIVNDQLFWGDICQDRIKYIRNFVFSNIDTLKACPQMPYHDPERPYVNYWFASTEGPDVQSFIKNCSLEQIEKLAETGGACIMYSHLANGFYENGHIHPGFHRLIEELHRKNGWFVPVGQLLDYILETRGPYTITNGERTKLERKWLIHKIRVGES